MKINILKSIFTLFSMLLKMLSYVLIPLLFLTIIFFILFFYHYFYLMKIKKIKPEKQDKKKIKEINFFKKLFYLFPRQLALDILMQKPNSFQEFGIHLICGKQGAGKTVTAVYLLKQWQQKYEKLKIFSNCALTFEDGELTHWKDLLTNSNGIYGVANLIDEIHTWFSNKESKDLPPEVLGEISQQRKQKKAILGTAQVFSRVAKPLREQTHFVYIPQTFLNVLTIVRMAEAEDYDYEKNKFKKYKKIFFFVHTEELRNSYDTFKRVERYKDVDFSASIYSSQSSHCEDDL